MRRFYLERNEDLTGVSGTGRVAEGYIFEDGTVTMRWLSEHRSTALYENIGEVEIIHGHDGKTKIVDADEPHAAALHQLRHIAEAAHPDSSRWAAVDRKLAWGNEYGVKMPGGVDRYEIAFFKAATPAQVLELLDWIERAYRAPIARLERRPITDARARSTRTHDL